MLTREEFENLHQDLWDSVKWKIRNKLEDILSGEATNLYDVDDYKKEALFSMRKYETVKNLTDTEKEVLEKYGCFACLVSAQKKGLSASSDNSCHCEYCPIIWGTEDKAEGYFCEAKGSPYDELQEKLYDFTELSSDYDVEEIMEIIDRIMELPINEDCLGPEV